jgi:poly(3-hydroxybutyrate) depolymerase
VTAAFCSSASFDPSSGSLSLGVPGAAAQTAPSATDTATGHYNAGRIDTAQYLSFGGTYGYIDPFTLYQLPDGTWTDQNPNGDTGGGSGGGSQPGSWETRSGLAGMEVHIYTPSGATGNGKRALMVALHGCAQANEIVRDNWSWQDEADEYGMVIAAPMAPNGGVIFGCWDYYDSNHSRSFPSRHDDNLINLTQSLLADTDLDIDPDQVYISGLSSGGGQSFVMGCLAPEIFAGIGIAAGPAVGTGSNSIGSVSVSASQTANTCRSFADANNQEGFTTQIASVVHGRSDNIVAQGYTDVNAAALANVYGASADGGSTSISGGGTQTTFSDADGTRVQKIFVTNLDHAWPASSDSSGGAYTNHTTIDYPAVLTAFLFENNRRVVGADDQTPPAVPQNLAADSITANGVRLTWDAVTDADLSVYNVYEGQVLVQSVTEPVVTIASLQPGTQYAFSVSAEDNAGNESERSASVSVTTLTGGGGTDTTPPSPPVGLAVSASSETSLTLSWQANPEQDLSQYEVFLEGAPVATTSSLSYSFGNLSSDTDYSLGVRAYDLSGNISQLSQIVGRTDAPAFACTATRSSNYTHVLQGRAVRCGSFNSYACAVGSGDNLGFWNTFTTTTVAETSSGFYELGSCQ